MAAGEKYEVSLNSLPPVFPLLRWGLYHTTSIDGYMGMRKVGYIMPNDGRFPQSYPQSGNCYARYRGFVPFFDFEKPTEKQIFEQFWNWEGFFRRHKPLTIVLGFRRDTLASRLVTYDDARQEVGNTKVKIPYVEVWYPEPVPLSLLDRVILIRPSDPQNYLVISAEADGLSTLDKELNSLLCHRSTEDL